MVFHNKETGIAFCLRLRVLLAYGRSLAIAEETPTSSTSTSEYRLLSFSNCPALVPRIRESRGRLVTAIPDYCLAQLGCGFGLGLVRGFQGAGVAAGMGFVCRGPRY